MVMNTAHKFGIHDRVCFPLSAKSKNQATGGALAKGKNSLAQFLVQIPLYSNFKTHFPMFRLPLFLCMLGCSAVLSAQGLKDLQKKASGAIKAATGSTEITQDEAGRALKEAFAKGTEWGVAQVSKENGYFGNPSIKIPFPADAKNVESKLRSLGMNALCDDVILSVNRAAEDAGPQAKAIFLNAIQSMTLNDALALVRGGEQSGTDYLKRSTQAELVTAFRPIIKTSLEKVGATRFWAQAIGAYNKIPFIEKANPDLVDFATQKAIDGLFVMVAAEEKKIRKDPMARSSELLKKVFGARK